MNRNSKRSGRQRHTFHGGALTRPIATSRLDALCACTHSVADHLPEEPGGPRPGCLECRCTDPCQNDRPLFALVVRQAVA